MRYKAIGFDMDGTLVDSVINYERLAKVEAEVLGEMGVPTDLLGSENDKEVIDAGMKYLESHGEGIDPKELEKAINRRAGEIESEFIHLAKPYPGVEEMLIRLKTEGYTVGLLTRGQRSYAEKAMGMFDIMRYMDAMQAYDDHPLGEQKPNPIAMEYLAKELGVRPKDILYVGDSPVDYFCARDAGSDFIAIANGKSGRASWSRFEGLTVVDDVTKITDFL